MNTTKVDVAVRHANAVVGAGLASLLARDSALSVNDDEASAPIVVTDYRTGIELLSAAPTGRAARVILYTSRRSGSQVRFAMEQGASGYVVMQRDPAEILAAVRRVADGNRYLCAAASRRLVELKAIALTDREQQVLECVAQGDANKIVARRLGIALGTVKAHMKGLLEKLHAASRTEAVAKAIAQGLLEPDAGASSD